MSVMRTVVDIGGCVKANREELTERKVRLQSQLNSKRAALPATADPDKVIRLRTQIDALRNRISELDSQIGD